MGFEGIERKDKNKQGQRVTGKRGLLWRVGREAITDLRLQRRKGTRLGQSWGEGE